MVPVVAVPLPVVVPPWILVPPTLLLALAVLSCALGLVLSTSVTMEPDSPVPVLRTMAQQKGPQQHAFCPSKGA